jgi:aminoglycoside phosphotransferase (APT) family kinase protein
MIPQAGKDLQDAPRLGGRGTDPPSEIVGWIESSAEGRVARLVRLPGGNRREAWLVDVASETTLKKLFLRYDPADPEKSDDYFSLRREAEFYAALAPTAVAIPRLIGLHPSGGAMLTERVEGESSYMRIASADAKQAVALDLMRHLVSLHKVDLNSLASLPQDPRTSILDCTTHQIAIWEKLYRETDSIDPLIEYALRWLLKNIPAVKGLPRLVHGDAGPGNFLFSKNKVTALIDWELAHLGDPLEDLAWLSMRTTLEPFPDFVACLREYEAEMGEPVDLGRVRYHRVFVQWHVAIIRHRDHGEDRANSLISRALNRRLLVLAVAQASGVALPPFVRLDASDTPHSREFDSALTLLRDSVAPAVSDPFGAAKVKSVARLVKYLRQCDRLADAADAAERADLSVLMGQVENLGAARSGLAVRIRAGDFDDEALLAHFTRQTGRDTQLMEDAMGALAWRPFPSLEKNA